MSVTLKIPTPLRKVTNGQSEVSVEGTSLLECIDALDVQFPGIKERLCGDDGELHRFVNVYLNGEDIRFLEGLKTPVKNDDEVSIVPAVAGG
ncbi:MAG: ubiquitin-like small modifier protein 1 [Dehalococcoidia bacterium]